MEEKTKINYTSEQTELTSRSQSEEQNTINASLSSNDSTIKATVIDNPIKTERNDHQLSNRNLLTKLFSTLKTLKSRFISTYSKRHPIVNALLSLFLGVTIIVSVMIAITSVNAMFSEYIGKDVWSIGLCGIFYPLFCCYFVCRFVIGNHKNAILPTFMGSTLVWYVILFFIVMVTTPNSEFIDEDGNEDYSSTYFIGYILPFILSLILNVLSFGIVYLIMKIKKYGATAWTLLDINRGRRPLFERICLILFFIFWLIPVGVAAYDEYRLKNPDEEFPTHSTAKVGDYYYDDGTISSEYLPDKKAIGVVFSLETSDTDKSMGYKHGQIVALDDAVSYKTPWDKGEPMDYPRYPNYTWDNRLDALKDIDGRDYKKCDNTYCLDINLRCDDYLNGSVQGISDWYLPTAGQWTKIIENLGNTKVDRMLKFDSAMASQNLEKININPQRWYWTITEFDAENAWSIRLANGEFGSRSNKQNGAYVRPVASF